MEIATGEGAVEPSKIALSDNYEGEKGSHGGHGGHGVAAMPVDVAIV
jgi:hypothetical protein